MDISELDYSLKLKLKQTFKFCIEFFKEHGINWYAAGGTVLGAVRHKDIIPWDDDIDIMVPRKDYNKLLDLASTLYGTSYSIASTRNFGYYLGAAKIVDETTTLWEAPRFRYPLGVFVDIFPIDQFDYEIEQYSTLLKEHLEVFEKYARSISKPGIKDFMFYAKTKHPNALLDLFKGCLYSSKKAEELYKSFLGIDGIFDQGKGRYVASPFGAYGCKEYFPAEYFDTYEELPFGDLEIRVPGMYKEYLGKMYGNYMELPPIEKRKSHHELYYLNLKERISLEEAQKRINSGESIVY